MSAYEHPKIGFRGFVSSIPFLLIHLAPLALLWTGVSKTAVVVGVVLFWVRMFGITAGYHRYFSHRSFKTSRPMQFFFAFLSQTSAQQGVLWWAAHHRRHHKFSDQQNDTHSPVKHGFWYSHVGWIWTKENSQTHTEVIKDFAAYPELRFLDRFDHLPAVLLALSCLFLGGWDVFLLGFCASTVVLWHSTFLINSLAHVFGSRRFRTSDDSRNNFWLALLTMGEGWHNNHHHYQSSVRQGFYWWEIDGTYYILKVMSWFGLVWDLKVPTEKALAKNRISVPKQVTQAAIVSQPFEK